MSWTTPQDVQDRWVGAGVPTDTDLIQALIDDAESVILSDYPGIQVRIDDDELPINTVILVVCRMVTRLLRNPESLNYVQQTTGPFGQARNFGDNVDIWLSADEKSLLAPNRSGKAYSFNSAPDMRSPDYWPFPNPETTEPIWRQVN